MSTRDATYQRVCTLRAGHEGDHLPYYAAPYKDPFNKQIEQPRCLHVSPAPADEGERYRVVFELIDPRFPSAGWHEVVRETSELRDAEEQLEGLYTLEREGEVRNPRIERAVIRWEAVT